MKKAYFCFSVARSGHHAIMNWMMSHLAPIKWKVKKTVKIASFPQLGYVQGARIKQSGKLNEISSARFDREKQKGHVFINCENQYLILDFSTLQIPFDKICNVLILRDPFNNIASTARTGSNAKWAISLWKIYAREFLGKSDNLVNKLIINYNEWVLSEQYRKSISKQIGGEPNTEVLNYVPNQGQGSSFDKLNFQDKAQEMKVFDRWKTMDPKVKKLFDDEVFDLAEQIFGKDFVKPILALW